ncbi:MAG TPA: TIM barrel protein [Candidatus Sulfopaludibacter sp.]|jgi:xylose isomerase|nr:TIM barrel protein [Candidatus Sulfopaludibacter sp.]
MQPIPENQQHALVSRLTSACGGSYTPEIRRKYFISGPQWAAAYQGQALFHAPTRPEIGFEEIIRKYGEIGIGWWTTHDTDVIPTEALGRVGQAEIVGRIKKALAEHNVQCSMVTTETFHHAVWAASPAAEAPAVREYAKFRVQNTVDIGHELGASFAVYWPGSLGYYVQGAIDETQTLRWYADALNAACEHDIAVAAKKGRPTLKHCLEAKPFEPQAEILLPTSDAMLAFIASGLLTHPEMVGLNPEYLHELMWGCAPRAALARALVAGKLFHFDINDGYRLKHDVDIAIGLVNPLDWLNVLVLLRSHGYNGPFNLDYKPPRTTSQSGVFEMSFPTAVDRFITLWEMAGEVLTDPIISEATEALKAGGANTSTDPRDADAIVRANRELLTLHELIAHRLFQILLGLHRGRTYSIA